MIRQKGEGTRPCAVFSAACLTSCGVVVPAATCWTHDNGGGGATELGVHEEPGGGGGVPQQRREVGGNTTSLGGHYMTQPLVELYGGCMVVLKIS